MVWRTKMNRKREEIVNTTIELFLKVGIRKITMDDIAQNANVSKVTIYKYFLDKDSLYAEVCRHICASYTTRMENIVACEADLKQRLYDYLDIIAECTNSGHYALCHELRFYNLEAEKAYEAFMQTYKRTMLRLIDAGIERKLIKNSLKPDEIFHYIDMSISYYQQNAAYREKVQYDSDFKKRFLLFYISNIFEDGKEMFPDAGVQIVQSLLQRTIGLAKAGTKGSIDEIMKHLNMEMTIAESKFIDFALSYVNSDEGVKVMEYYLFHGTQVQRNYCALYFARLGEYPIVREAFDKGLIDAKQAFSR